MRAASLQERAISSSTPTQLSQPQLLSLHQARSISSRRKTGERARERQVRFKPRRTLMLSTRSRESSEAARCCTTGPPLSSHLTVAMTTLKTCRFQRRFSHPASKALRASLDSDQTVTRQSAISSAVATFQSRSIL